MTAVDLKLPDLLELSKVYTREYNMPELSDRVLVFDVMKDGWETGVVLTSSSGESDEASCLSRADTEHSDVKPSLKSDEEPLQDGQPRLEKETKQNDESKLSLLSESEAKPEAGSAADSTESNSKPLAETTLENTNDDNTISSSAAARDVAKAWKLGGCMRLFT